MNSQRNTCSLGLFFCSKNLCIYAAINQHRRLRLSITPPPPYPESSSTTPESLSEVCGASTLVPTLRIEPPPYKRNANSVTPPPPYPSSSSGSLQEPCRIEDVRTPSDHCPSPYQADTSRLQVHRDDRGRLSLPESAVREAVDIFSPTIFRPSAEPHGGRANSNPAIAVGASRRLSPGRAARSPRSSSSGSSTVLDHNIISVLGPEFTAERPISGQDCPQCGLTSNNVILYNARRNSDQCDTQGERMCTISMLRSNKLEMICTLSYRWTNARRLFTFLQLRSRWWLVLS